MNKKVLMSTVVASLLFLSGCGDGGGNSSNDENTEQQTTTQQDNTKEEKTTTSGVAADGYLKGAKVCLDINNNGKCDNSEPTTTTDENGNFSLDYNSSVSDATLLVMGGEDIERKIPFNYTLKAPLDAKNITPFTTLIYADMQKNKATYSQAIDRVADILGISTNDVVGDPTKSNKLKKLALKLQIGAEFIAKIKDKNILDCRQNPVKISKRLRSDNESKKD